MDSYALKQALHGVRNGPQGDQGQRTTGPRDQRTTGPKDQRTRRAEDQRGLKHQRTRAPRTRGPRTREPEDQTTKGPGDPSHTFQRMEGRATPLKNKTLGSRTRSSPKLLHVGCSRESCRNRSVEKHARRSVRLCVVSAEPFPPAGLMVKCGEVAIFQRVQATKA